MSSPPPTTTSTHPAPTIDYLNSLARQQPINHNNHNQPSIYQNLRNPTPQQQQQQQQQQRQPRLPYPVPVSSSSSSGRPFLPNSAYSPYRPNAFTAHHFYHNNHLPPPPAPAPAGSVMHTAVTGVSASANPKVAGQSSFADDKSLKTNRDKNGDDTFVVIRDRKVPISEGTSFYAQCRSWLKNGHTLENQPQYVDSMKSLPKPLPASVVEVRKEDTEMEECQKIEDVENMSAKELLQQHVRHAKKVRVRLRNQRLQRIERYKDRLALLLPPVVDQPPKNDPTS